MYRCPSRCCGCYCCNALTSTPLRAKQLSWHDVDAGVQSPRFGRNLILHVWCYSTRRHIRLRRDERGGHHEGGVPRLPSGWGPDLGEGSRPGGHDGGYLRLSGGDGVPLHGDGIMGGRQHLHLLRLGNRLLVLKHG